MASIPSIALIPSGYKASKLYSVLPTNGNADLTVVRNSTANRINKDGLIESMAVNVPLLDHSNGTCPSLLLQPQSTNLITYPLSFDNAYWTKVGATVTGGFSSPSVDNPTSAFKLVENTSTGVHKIQHTEISTSSNNSYSVYFKPNGITKFGFRETKETGYYASFDLTLGTVIDKSAQVTASVTTLNNGWSRCVIHFPVTASTIMTIFTLNDSYTSGDPASFSYTGDGTSGVYIFGAQLEQQSFATSLMLPNAEGSTTTRLKDEVSKSGLSSEINSVEGTLFVEMSALVDDLSERRLSLSDSISSNVVRVGYTNISNRIIAVVFNGSNQAVMTYTSSDITVKSKIAVKYKENDFALWVDGVERAIDSIGTTFSENTLNRIGFDGGSGVSNSFNKTNQLQVFKTALTDAELAVLTTI